MSSNLLENLRNYYLLKKSYKKAIFIDTAQILWDEYEELKNKMENTNDEDIKKVLKKIILIKLNFLLERERETQKTKKDLIEEAKINLGLTTK